MFGTNIRFSEKNQIFGKIPDFQKNSRFSKKNSFFYIFEILEKTKIMAMTFRKHPQRSILEISDQRLDT